MSALRIQYINGETNYKKHFILREKEGTDRQFVVFDSDENEIMDGSVSEMAQFAHSTIKQFREENCPNSLDINITIDLYEDVGNDDIEVIKKHVIINDRPFVRYMVGCAEHIIPSVEEVSEADKKDVFLLYGILLMRLLVKMKRLNEGIKCSCCEVEELTVKYAPHENKDYATLNHIDLNDVNLDFNIGF